VANSARVGHQQAHLPPVAAVKAAAAAAALEPAERASEPDFSLPPSGGLRQVCAALRAASASR